MSSQNTFNFDVLIAYPKTKSLAKEDFIAPTCYYTCEETNNGVKCDLQPCLDYIEKREFPNNQIKIATRKIANELKDTSKYLTDKFDGFHIQYTPNEQQKAYNLINILRADSGSVGRSGVIELNYKRLSLLAKN